MKKGNDPYHNQVIVITGGSSGIGLAVAQQFYTRQARVILLARDKVRLEQAAHSTQKLQTGNPVKVIPTDVSNREEVKTAFQNIEEEFGRIDVLIVCAGVIRCGRFADIPYEDFDIVWSTNYAGVVNTIKEAWRLVAKAQGKIVLISSVAGYFGLIGYAAYAPTKFALTGLAECLRMEGKKEGIAVSIVYPPDTQTPLLEYENNHALPETKALNRKIKVLDAGFVAEKILKGMEANQFEIYCTLNSRLYRWLRVVLPNLFFWGIDQVLKQSGK